jgi:hypothetical protein
MLPTLQLPWDETPDAMPSIPMYLSQHPIIKPKPEVNKKAHIFINADTL